MTHTHSLSLSYSLSNRQKASDSFPDKVFGFGGDSELFAAENETKTHVRQFRRKIDFFEVKMSK